MAWTSKVILSLVELILYAVLAPIFIFTCHKHRTPSLTGHFYILAFITLRLVTDGLAISNRNASLEANTTGAIINSIGLSPLLLATAGFMNEARHYMLDYPHNTKSKKFGWLLELVLHVFVLTGVVLFAIGRIHFAKAKSPSDVIKFRGLQYGGAILLLLTWSTLCGTTIRTVLMAQRQKYHSQERQASSLLANGLILALVFIGIRVIYTMIYTFDSASEVQPQTATFAIYFCLLFLSQLIAVLILASTFLHTRNIATEFGGRSAVSAGAVE